MTGAITPQRIAALPIDPQRGVPVPWFVAWIDGKPDFRVIGTDRLATAIRFNRCWICGEERGRFGSFVIGPMCAVNRTSAEPPSHRDCAIYAAITCPFLTRPSMRRREAGMPVGTCPAAGTGIKRNPGVALVWTTRDWKWFEVGNGVLCQLGDPTETLWYAEGRSATRAEVDESIETGLPLLREECDREEPRRRGDAHRQLDAYIARAAKYLPAPSVAL